MKPYNAGLHLKVTHTREGMHLNTFKDMKDLVIISGINEKFILLDKDADNYSLKVYYIPFSLFNNGDYLDSDIINVEITYQYQIQENLSGWCVNDYDQPDYTTSNVYPGDDDFDYDLAERVALEAANEIVLQHENTTVNV